MINSFHKYVKAFGTGPKGNRNLSAEETIDCFQQILDGDAYPEQVVAFLLGWRLHEESDIELEATLEAFNKYMKKTTVPNSIELGLPYDGMKKHPYLFPLVARKLLPYGLNLVVSGDYLQPAKAGLTTQDLCEALTDKLEKNIYYFDRREYFPELSAITTSRLRLGVRTGINTVEKLLNPANSDFAITGVFHSPYISKYFNLFEKHYKNFVLVRAQEGSCEFFRKLTLWFRKDNEIVEEILDPSFYGVNYDKSYKAIRAEEALSEIENPSAELEKIVKLNTALLFFVAQKANSLKEAVEVFF